MLITYRPVAKAKLTITSEGASVIIPDTVRDHEEDILRLAGIVIRSVGRVKKTLRGRFYFNLPGRVAISMYWGNNELWGTKYTDLTTKADVPCP